LRSCSKKIELLHRFDIELKNIGFESGIDLPGLLAYTREDNFPERGFMSPPDALEFSTRDDVESRAQPA
jgi:hypothetical protein